VLENRIVISTADRDVYVFWGMCAGKGSTPYKLSWLLFLELALRRLKARDVELLIEEGSLKNPGSES